MGFRQICIESRCRCSYEGGYLVVTTSDETTKVHLSEISSLTFCSTKMYVSAYLLSELAKCKIPVVFCDEKSYPIAESLPLYGAHNCVKRSSGQLEWTLPSKKRLWQKIVQHKIGAQARVLDLLGSSEDADILRIYASEVKSGDPTNREAAAAGRYFAALFGPDFNRDLDIPENAALNYGYSILLSKVSREVVSRGYLTQLGIHHHSDLNQWNLPCDLMEPFRPFIDYTVLMAGIGDFNTEMRRLLIDVMNRYVGYRDGQYKLGSAVGLYVKDCLDILDKMIPVDDLETYTML